MAVVLILGVLFAIAYQPDISIETLKPVYAAAPSKFIDIDSLKVHYRDEGSATDTVPLVLIHGTSASLHTWQGCVGKLVASHRIIRLDMPAFGLTGPNTRRDYSIDYYVSFLHHFLTQLKVKQCYLAGNSLGGHIVWAYAAKYSEQVRKIVLLDAAGYPIEGAKGSLAFRLARIPVLSNLLTVVTPKSIVKKSLLDVYGDPAKVTDALVQQYHDLACRTGNRQALIDRLTQQQVGDTLLLGKLKMPVLIVWGEMDRLIPFHNAYKFHRDLSNDSLVVLPGIGHVPMEEVPDTTAKIMKAFLRQ